MSNPHKVTVTLVKTRHRYEGSCSECPFEVYAPDKGAPSKKEADRHASFHEDRSARDFRS